ncbi:MAG: TetR/AcrR family transcriptional regulator [Candidatus Cloacimonetes bacterium]|jgi:AcrR family transcriptional regulator|nr:TetR/AcrR family transcriptional regulator [Candidatus Cloacimonadota bacterium]
MMNITKRQMEIVQAAIQVIARQGYEKLTTKNIAKSLGVSDASLYRHFESKKELIKMILCYFEELSCEVIQNIKTQKLSPLDRIRLFVNSRYDMFEKEPDLAMVMFSEELFKNDPDFEQHYMSIMQIHRDEVLGYIMEGQQQDTIRSNMNAMHIFRIVVGSMRFLITQWNLSSHGFVLTSEGKNLTETIIKLIEVKQ